MEIVKIILVVIYTMFLYYRSGILIKKFIKSKETKISSTIIYGFILNFAIFEIINLPFIIFAKEHTRILYYIFIVLNIANIILSFIIKRKETRYNAKIKIEKNLTTVLWILPILVIGFQLFSSTFVFKENADDAFYITWANEARELETMYETDPSTGREESTFDNKYILNTWEIWGGFTARTFGLSTPTLFHTAYLIIYITISYMAYYLVLKKLLKKENVPIALLILAILFLFSGTSARFKGTYLLERIYQGKSILINIIMPFVIYKFLDYKNFTKEDYIILTLSYITSIACNPITVWFMSLVYGLFMLIILINKDFKQFKKSLLLLIPILVISVLYIILAMTKEMGLEAITQTETFNQLNSFNSFLGDGKIVLILYLISILVIYLKGTKEQKNLCVYLPILICLLVVNPLLQNIYVKVVTTVTYWRLFLLFPMELSIVIASTLIYDILEGKKNKIIYTASIVLIIIVSGKYFYREEAGFAKFETFKKIPQYILNEAEYIKINSEEKVKVVAPDEPWHSCMMRQYTSKIILMHSRAIINNPESEYKQLYLSIYNSEEPNYNPDKINEIIEKCDVQYIILPKTKTIKIDEKCKFKLELENEKDYILKRI